MSFITNLGMDTSRKFEAAIKSKSEVDVKEANQAINKSRLYAVAVTAASIAFAALGLALCATGAGTGFGIFLLMVSLPGLYAGLNSYKTFGNMKKMLDDAASYQKTGPLHTTPVVDIAAIRKDLSAGTLGFEWVIDYRIEQLQAGA